MRPSGTPSAATCTGTGSHAAVTANARSADPARGNYRLGPASPFKNAGTDGKDPGAAIDALEAATAGAVSGQ